MAEEDHEIGAGDGFAEACADAAQGRGVVQQADAVFAKYEVVPQPGSPARKRGTDGALQYFRGETRGNLGTARVFPGNLRGEEPGDVTPVTALC